MPAAGNCELLCAATRVMTYGRYPCNFATEGANMSVKAASASGLSQAAVWFPVHCWFYRMLLSFRLCCVLLALVRRCLCVRITLVLLLFSYICLCFSLFSTPLSYRWQVSLFLVVCLYC